MARLDGSSPHTRGALGTGGASASVAGIIPAYAGSTSKLTSTKRSRRDHPRIRGEHAAPSESDKWDEGSSPHTRGALSQAGDRGDAARIIPAYAGSTCEGRLGWGVPCGSSPHTRGAHFVELLGGGADRIIPAYAGST